jgi:DTW domain-containing protein YfiP
MLLRAPRAVCYRCDKPAVTCLCARVPHVENRTSVTVLQHPRERVHPLGTVRIARLGLSRLSVEVAWNAGTREDTPPAWLPSGAALLYPGPDARPLEDLLPHERPPHLVVIDGTWHTARTLFRDKAWLRRLPRYRLSPTAPSRYRIRREPARDYVSTLEAIVEALRVLEPDTEGLDGLLAAFDSMIDEQLVFIEGRPGVPRVRERRAEAWRRRPRALAEDFGRLVVAYGESARPDPRGPRALVQWTAVARATGEAFECFLRPEWGLPSPAHLAHMRLREEDFDGGADVPSFVRRWAEFLARSGPLPIVAAWNQSTLDLLATTTGTVASRVALKSAYRSLRGGGSGSLDEVARAERVVEAPLPFRGRAAERVARAVAVSELLHRAS